MSVIKKDDRIYTYRDYCAWPDAPRCELIDGSVYAMSPAPSDAHQRVVGELFRQIANGLINHHCQVRVAPYDVRLDARADNHDHDVVQPDIVVICDANKLDDKGCRGVPDWVIEVVSPGTAGRDYILKLRLYEQFGVPEYWIVHPIDKVAMVYRLNDSGEYGKPAIYAADTLESNGSSLVEIAIIDGLKIDLSRL
jgi:Uma2 family endonuclease